MNWRDAFRRGGASLLALSLILIAGVALAAVQPESGISFPRDVSLDGYRIDSLIEVTGVFVIILFVIMCMWMVGACVLYGKNHQARYDHGSGRNQVFVALVISAVIFFVVDGNLFVTAIIDLDEAFWNFEKAESNPDAVRVELNAHQWAWDFRYAGADGKFSTPDDIVVLNDFRIPVGVPIIMELAAVDVIHSLYLPNLRVKTDAVPGMVNKLWFQATETGEFDIACAQHCGTHHYKMKGKITILPKAEFDAWAKEMSMRAQLLFDPADLDAQWGWPWKRG
jgi:cytochrome c oxidase subunit 2